MSLFTADQIVAHLVGDYILQSHWMATEKTRSGFAATIHALCYTLPFALIASPTAAILIFASHFFVDRYRLARFVVWAKNGPFHVVYHPNDWQSISPFRHLRLKPLTATGYQEDVPAWLSVWLLIIADNTIHLVCNGLAIWGFPA